MGSTLRKSSIMKLLLVIAALCSVAYCRRERVVGGSDVQPVGKWPWQGSLQFRSSGSHTCGSSLISATHAITAAHCVRNSATSYRVVFGLHDRTTRREGRPENYNIAALRRHPQFALDGSRGFPNDVATLRLASNANLNNIFIDPVSMAPNDGHMYVGDECYISGWGRLRGGGPLPNVLQEPGLTSSVSRNVSTTGDLRGSSSSTSVSSRGTATDAEPAMEILVALCPADVTDNGGLWESPPG